MKVMPPYFQSPHDTALFASAETLIQPPSGTRLPELDTGRMRYVLASNGLFVQTRTNTIEASVRIAELPDSLPYGKAREGIILRHGQVPDELWLDLKRRAVSACPLEWSAYVLCDDDGFEIVEPEIHSRSDSHISYTPLRQHQQERLLMHVHSHGFGEAYFSVRDDEADRTSGDGVYIAAVIGRCQTVASATLAQRLVVWRWLLLLF